MKVLVFGGTHGNEWTGVMAVTHNADRLKKKHPGLDLDFILANPEAYKINKRFKDEDLNRAFQFLGEDRKSSYEHARAREIKSMIDAAPCFVIDLHTTTANMGTTVILTHLSELNLQVSAELLRRIPDCRVISSPDPTRKYLAGQSLEGLMIEVGPVANGVIEASALESTIAVLENVLMIIDHQQVATHGKIDLFEEIEDVYYPTDKQGQISAYIHKSLQDKDFLPLRGNYPAFQSFDGETVERQAKEELFPIFINEAAYYPQKIAFILCRKTVKNY